MKTKMVTIVLAATVLAADLVLAGCVLSVSTPPPATPTTGPGNAEAGPGQTAGAEARTTEISIAGTPPAGELPATSTPAAFLPLIKEPGEIEASDLENLEIAAVVEVENPLYSAQLGSPTYLSNFAHAESGCNWLGVAGQVFDLRQQPVKDLIVEVGGDLPGADLPALGMTGLAPAYGPGGYEVTVADRAAASQESIWIQVFDLSGRPLSEMYYVDTLAGCGQNLILVNFQQEGFMARLFLPTLLKDQVPAR